LTSSISVVSSPMVASASPENFGAALHYQHLDRTVAENLHDERAVELQVRREQRAGGHHFAEYRAHRRRIVAAGQHFLPRIAQRNDFAAHGRRAEHEFLQLVVHNFSSVESRSLMRCCACALCASGMVSRYARVAP
jgi:hypothetical protein